LEESSPEEVFGAATALGAPHVNAILVGRAPGVDACAASFAMICDRAAEHGLSVTLEFGPHRAVRDLAEAVAVVRDAGRANGAVLYDTWHAHWGSPPRPWHPPPGAERVLTIQVNDAPSERPADLARATRFRRLAPGDGAIPLAGIVGALRTGGSEAPLVAEVFNAHLLELHGPLGFARLLSARLKEIEAGASAT
jgi:sugar phosphate isomerase/epimerase